MTGIIRGEALTPQPRLEQGEKVDVEQASQIALRWRDSIDGVTLAPKAFQMNILCRAFLALQAELEAAREWREAAEQTIADGRQLVEAAREREKGLRGCIELRAAKQAYDADLGASEWEAFLTTTEYELLATTQASGEAE